MTKYLRTFYVSAPILAVIAGAAYLQWAIIRDCGFMAIFSGAEWWWLMGYCR